MSNRQDIAFLTPFANDAETTLPGVPIDGTSYRDTTFSNLGPGWPYKTKVESQDFNQIMYIQTLLMRQLSNQGILDYSDKEDYSANNALVKDNGGLYMCLADNGPSSSIKQPSTDSEFWRRVDITEISPRNNQWNGYLDPEHQLSLPAPNGYPGNSGGGEVFYAADSEISLGIFAGSGGATVSSDSNGWIFTGSIYRVYDYTTEQLNDINGGTAPVYIKDQSGTIYFLTNSTNGVNVSKSSSQLKIEITGSIFSELGITKLWRWFDTEIVGRVGELGPDSSVNAVMSSFDFRTVKDLTSSRSTGVNYTNNNPYSISVYVYSSLGDDVAIDAYLDNNIVLSTDYGNNGFNVRGSLFFSIPPKSTYRVEILNGTLSKWSERS